MNGTNVFVGYGNGVAKDGSDGKSSTIVEYASTGAIVQTFSVPGHNDGLKVDPATHLVWALQNEDANPNLVIINPTAGTETQYTFAAAPLAGRVRDLRLAMEIGAIQRLAESLAARLAVRDPLSEPVHHGKVAAASLAVLGVASLIGARLAPRRAPPTPNPSRGLSPP